MDVLYLVAPAYNEEGNIERFVREWYPVVESHSANGSSRLLVVDDGSSDTTYELLIAMRDSFPLLEPKTKANGGHGAAVQYAYRYALAAGADYIFQTDSDCQTDPEEFEVFWVDRKEYEAQFGNRIARGDGKIRMFVERIVCLLVRLYFGESIPDANAPFRLMSRGFVEQALSLMPEDYCLPNVVLTVFGAKHGQKSCFKNISFKSRVAGKNSVNMRRIIGIGWQALKGFPAIKKNMNRV